MSQPNQHQHQHQPEQEEARNDTGGVVNFRSDDEVLFEAGSGPSLLGEIKSVVAVCTAMKRAVYFRQPKLVFTFTVVEPDQYAGQKLEMFAHAKWKGQPPVSSKLFKIAAVALGRLPQKGDRITKNLFLRKVFRCKLGISGQGAAAYSVVEIPLEKLTG